MIPSHDFALSPKSNMVICSLGTGENHEKQLKLMKPTVEYYGRLHNIDTLFFTKSFLPNKLAKRNKIFLLFNLLKYYEIVMWMDSDSIFVNPKEDIRNELNSDHVLYMTSYFHRDPLFPNSGVIVIKRDPRVIEILEKVWAFKRKNKRGWWDQQAFLKLLGYKNQNVRILSYHGPTTYTPLIGPLDLKWNSRPNRKDVSKNPNILHHCGLKWERRIEEMEESFKEFLKNTNQE